MAWYTTQERIDKAPFTDIRVREAMTEAIDLPTIAKTYFNGTV
jgi:ABC-type oligopeptide transport system substrate-binding subunit